MAVRAKASEHADVDPKESEIREDEQSVSSVGEQEIRDRAYEIFCQRGPDGGSELDDWLQAERELKESRR